MPVVPYIHLSVENSGWYERLTIHVRITNGNASHSVCHKIPASRSPVRDWAGPCAISRVALKPSNPGTTQTVTPHAYSQRNHRTRNATSPIPRRRLVRWAPRAIKDKVFVMTWAVAHASGEFGIFWCLRLFLEFGEFGRFDRKCGPRREV